MESSCSGIYHSEPTFKILLNQMFNNKNGKWSLISLYWLVTNMTRETDKLWKMQYYVCIQILLLGDH